MRRDHGRSMAVVALAAAVALGGCASVTYKYTYDPAATFSGAKTYQWARSTSYAGPDALLDGNVRFHADRALEAKGWKKVADQPELVFSPSFEYEIMTIDRYQLRLLNLRASRPDTGEPVWRGTAQGSIDASATSGELKAAVNGIVATFPPK